MKTKDPNKQRPEILSLIQDLSEEARQFVTVGIILILAFIFVFWMFLSVFKSF